MDEFSDKSFATETNYVAVNLLHKRMANELYNLANICAEVEAALGDVIEKSDLTNSRSIITLQGLDRIRQSLEDFARLTTFLSLTNEKKEPNQISISDINKSIILSQLATRLTQPFDTISIENDTESDVLWY